MKKLFIISLLSLASCTSNKILMDYMEQEIKKEGITKIVIYEDKASVKYTINTLRGPTSNGKRSGPTSMILRDTDFLFLYEKYKNDTVNEAWKKSDFKNFDIKVINSEISLDNKVDLITKGYRYFYFLSKPLFLDENLGFFYFSKASGWTVLFSGVVVMKKTDGKWEVVEKVQSTELN